jgi:hypothetical protein
MFDYRFYHFDSDCAPRRPEPRHEAFVGRSRGKMRASSDGAASPAKRGYTFLSGAFKRARQFGKGAGLQAQLSATLFEALD